MNALKRLIPLFLIMASLISLVGIAMGATASVKVFVDGKQVDFPDQAPFINRDSRILVPVRFVSEALGAKVGWDGPKEQVSVRQDSKNILLNIGQRRAKVNEGEVILDTAASLFNNRTMVPLRFVSECLGAKVDWNGAQQAVYITTAGSDQALVNSDILVSPPYSDSKPGDLEAIILYKYTTPLEPQIQDLKELLEKRFSSKAQSVVDYVSQKKDTDTILLDKEWVIDGKTIRVTDNVGSVSVTVRG